MRAVKGATRIGRSAMPGAPRGFTLVEALVAIIVLAIGVLGLAASAGTVLRLTGGAATQTLAASIASSRLDSLRGMPCPSVVSGSDTSQGVAATWTGSGGGKSRYVAWTVSYRTPTGSAARAYQTVLAC
ncbi:MAG: hypothetical protein NVS9B3_09590 [Gemmatimonadaceae bacterium]